MDCGRCRRGRTRPEHRGFCFLRRGAGRGAARGQGCQLDTGAQCSVLPGHGRAERTDGVANGASGCLRGVRVLERAEPGERVLHVAAAPLDGGHGRFRGLGLPAVLHLLGDRADPHVFPDLHVGDGKAHLLGDEVRCVHVPGVGVYVGGHSGPLLRHGNVRHDSGSRRSWGWRFPTPR